MVTNSFWNPFSCFDANDFFLRWRLQMKMEKCDIAFPPQKPDSLQFVYKKYPTTKYIVRCSKCILAQQSASLSLSHVCTLFLCLPICFQKIKIHLCKIQTLKMSHLAQKWKKSELSLKITTLTQTRHFSAKKGNISTWLHVSQKITISILTEENVSYEFVA